MNAWPATCHAVFVLSIGTPDSSDRLNPLDTGDLETMGTPSWCAGIGHCIVVALRNRARPALTCLTVNHSVMDDLSPRVILLVE